MFKKHISIYDSVLRKSHDTNLTGHSQEELDEKVKKWKTSKREEIALRRLEKDKELKEASIPHKPFALEMLDNGAVSIGLIGASRSGKSSCMKYIYKKYYRKHIGVMFSLSDHNDIYKDMSRKLIIANDFQPSVLREMYLCNHGTDNKYKFLAILDDVNGGKSKSDQEVTRLLTLYRNSYIDAMICNQSPTLINAVGRANLNYLCLFSFNSASEIEKTIKFYLNTYFPTSLKMSEKIQMYKKLTEDHHFFFLNNLEGTCCLCKLSPEQLACEIDTDEE
jgi:hypothetical protein